MGFVSGLLLGAILGLVLGAMLGYFSFQRNLEGTGHTLIRKGKDQYQLKRVSLEDVR